MVKGEDKNNYYETKTPIFKELVEDLSKIKSKK